MGNSEVGHMNIGAGRIVYQDLLRINRAIEAGSFEKESVLQAAFDRAKAQAPACTSWASSHKAVCIPSKRT